MPRLMDIGLDKLTNTLLGMANLAEKSVARSLEACASGKNSLEEIHQWSEDLRRMQEEVSELSVELLVRYQPMASDLRFIKSCMEIAYGFSRFGRYAYDISEVLEEFGDLSGCDHTTVDVVAKSTKEMIRMSIDAFAKRDVELAKNIGKLDDFVDEKYREHVGRTLRDPNANVKCAMSGTLILRYLERIADHSAYIGESVLYIVSGTPNPRK
jgi:phosphate transport system protein